MNRKSTSKNVPNDPNSDEQPPTKKKKTTFSCVSVTDPEYASRIRKMLYRSDGVLDEASHTVEIDD